MRYLNEIIGLIVFGLGVVTFIICLAAFVKVVFGRQPRKGAADIMKQIDALLKTWIEALKIIPEGLRHIFLLLPFGIILMLGGYYTLAFKPF